MFRQDPGDENSLGIVKINFPSPDGVYMHDTPHKGLFNDDYRFDSSGCVRVQNIRELIVWLLRDTPGRTPRRDRRRVPQRRAHGRQGANPVPLFWTYITAWATRTASSISATTSTISTGSTSHAEPPQVPASRSSGRQYPAIAGGEAPVPWRAPRICGNAEPGSDSGRHQPAGPAFDFRRQEHCTCP